jgi:radical SAM protein with 4Fe4S-binding SPASM domain
MRPRVNAIALELTRYCNQKCGYCYNAWRDEPQAAGRMDDRLLGRVERLLDTLDVGYFTLTGGEPFAYKGVFDVLGLIRGRGIPVQLISNGGLFDDALAERLAAYRPRSIQITLNGPSAALHEEHVGEGHFEKTLAGIRALARHRVRVVGCMVVTRKNAHAVGETLALWKSLGVNRVALSRFSPAGYAANQVAELLPGRGDIVAAFEQALPYAEDGMHVQCTMPVPPCSVEVERFRALHFGNCAIGTEHQEFALGPDGRLRNCTLHRSAIGDAGDIIDPSVDIAAIVQHAEVRDYRSQVPEFCRGCRHERTCAGGCGAAADWVLGSRTAHPDPFLSQYINAEFAGRLARLRAGKRKLAVV